MRRTNVDLPWNDIPGMNHVQVHIKTCVEARRGGRDEKMKRMKRMDCPQNSVK